MLTADPQARRRENNLHIVHLDIYMAHNVQYVCCMETAKATAGETKMATYTKISTGEKWTVNGSGKKADQMFVVVRTGEVNKKYADKKVSLMKFVVCETGDYTCEENGKIVARFNLPCTFYTPACVMSSAAKIDSAMDGGINSMGMLRAR